MWWWDVQWCSVRVMKRSLSIRNTVSSACVRWSHRCKRQLKSQQRNALPTFAMDCYKTLLTPR